MPKTETFDTDSTAPDIVRIKYCTEKIGEIVLKYVVDMAVINPFIKADKDKIINFAKEIKRLQYG